MDSSELVNPAAQRRHAAMLDRLAARAAARSATTSSSATASAAPAFESVQAFLARFADAKRSIESDMAGIHSSADPKPELGRLSAAVSALDRLVADHSYFLPPYELRSSLKSIGELKESLESLSSDLAPRKKFSFKNKPSKAPSKDPATKDFSNLIKGNEEIRVFDVEKSDLGVLKPVWESPGFKHREGSLLVKKFRGSEEGEGDFSLSDLNACEVCLKGPFRALFIHRLKNCRVFVGPVLGSIHIEEVEGCLFMLASHQIRIHQAKETDFYLRVRSRPIIEDCTGVRFAPYRLVYEGIDDELKDSGLGEETENWANVDDFKWLRAVQSPNWCILPEEERMGIRDISDLEEKCENN